MKKKDRPPGNWECEGQLDLTDLVDDEHIAGSMPASEADNDKAREAFYQQLRDRQGRTHGQ